MAETEFAAVLGRWESDFGLWPPVLRTIAVFLAFGGGSMSVELVRWLPKPGVFLSVPVGTQRACQLVPTDIPHMAVEGAPPPLGWGSWQDLRAACGA